VKRGESDNIGDSDRLSTYESTYQIQHPVIEMYFSILTVTKSNQIRVIRFDHDVIGIDNKNVFGRKYLLNLRTAPLCRLCWDRVTIRGPLVWLYRFIGASVRTIASLHSQYIYVSQRRHYL